MTDLKIPDPIPTKEVSTTPERLDETPDPIEPDTTEIAPVEPDLQRQYRQKGSPFSQEFLGADSFKDQTSGIESPDAFAPSQQKGTFGDYYSDNLISSVSNYLGSPNNDSDTLFKASKDQVVFEKPNTFALGQTESKLDQQKRQYARDLLEEHGMNIEGIHLTEDEINHINESENYENLEYELNYTQRRIMARIRQQNDSTGRSLLYGITAAVADPITFGLGMASGGAGAAMAAKASLKGITKFGTIAATDAVGISVDYGLRKQTGITNSSLIMEMAMGTAFAGVGTLGAYAVGKSLSKLKARAEARQEAIEKGEVPKIEYEDKLAEVKSDPEVEAKYHQDREAHLIERPLTKEELQLDPVEVEQAKKEAQTVSNGIFQQNIEEEVDAKRKEWLDSLGVDEHDLGPKKEKKFNAPLEKIDNADDLAPTRGVGALKESDSVKNIEEKDVDSLTDEELYSTKHYSEMREILDQAIEDGVDVGVSVKENGNIIKDNVEPAQLIDLLSTKKKHKLNNAEEIAWFDDYKQQFKEKIKQSRIPKNTRKEIRDLEHAATVSKNNRDIAKKVISDRDSNVHKDWNTNEHAEIISDIVSDQNPLGEVFLALGPTHGPALDVYLNGDGARVAGRLGDVDPELAKRLQERLEEC